MVNRIDIMLETVLPATSKAAYGRALVVTAEKLSWGQADDGVHRDGDPLGRMLWGFATRLQEYSQPDPEIRTRRDGLPWTWTEVQIVRWATLSRSKTAAARRSKRADAAYLAVLLQRGEDECAKAINKWGPAQGRRGFV